MLELTGLLGGGDLSGVRLKVTSVFQALDLVPEDSVFLFCGVSIALGLACGHVKRVWVLGSCDIFARVRQELCSGVACWMHWVCFCL